MKLLLDANISFRVVKKIQATFPDSLHVERTGLVQPAKDRTIWHFARQNDFIIVTYDEDFYELSNLYGAPPKVIWFRFGNVPTDIIVQKLLKYQQDIELMATNSDIDLLEIY